MIVIFLHNYAFVMPPRVLLMGSWRQCVTRWEIEVVSRFYGNGAYCYYVSYAPKAYCYDDSLLSVKCLSLKCYSLAIGGYKHHASLLACDVANDIHQAEAHDALLLVEGYGEE